LLSALTWTKRIIRRVSNDPEAKDSNATPQTIHPFHFQWWRTARADWGFVFIVSNLLCESLANEFDMRYLAVTSANLIATRRATPDHCPSALPLTLCGPLYTI
jgi:hypothetical protein